MSEDERGVLKQHTNPSRYLNAIKLFFFGGFAVFLFIASVLSFGGELILPLIGFPAPNQYKWDILIVSAILAAILIASELYREIGDIRKAKAGMNPAAHDLKENVTLVSTLEVRACVEIEQFDDEGAGFLLELTDGRVLCLIGQDLYDFSVIEEPDPDTLWKVSSPPFPSERIELSYPRKTKIIFGVRGVGTYLRPRSMIRYGENGPTGNKGLEPDTFYRGDLEKVLARFGFVEEPLPPSRT